MSLPLDVSARYVGRRVVVLGAAGFIGRWVARALTGCDANLTLVVRDAARATPIFDTYAVQGAVVELDLGDLARVRNCLASLRPTVVFNLAGYGVDRGERDPEVAYRINAHLVAALGEALADYSDPHWTGQALVHVGSALEYGALGGNLSEEVLPHPTTLYGQSKLAGTCWLARACQAHSVRGITARLFTVYGPGEHPGRLWPTLQEAARSGQPLPLTAGQQQRDFTYVEDVAEGLVRLGVADAPPGAIVNLATGRLTSVRRFAEMAASSLGIPSDHLQFGALPTRGEEMTHEPVTVERLRRLLGWTPPTSLEVGMRRAWRFEAIAMTKEMSHGLPV